MYQLTIKGNDFEELKVNVNKLNDGLNPCTIKIDEKIFDGLGEYRQSSVCAETAPELAETVADLVKLKEDTDKMLNSIKESNDNGEIDTEGLPWDKRIHTVAKTKVKAGTWKVKKGLEKDFVEVIKAELKKKIAFENNPPVIPTAPIAPSTPIVENLVMNANVAPPVLTDTVTAPTVALPTMGNGHTLESFSNNFPLIIASLITDGKVTQQYVNQLKDYFKVEQIWAISNEQKAEVFNSFVDYGFITKVG